MAHLSVKEQFDIISDAIIELNRHTTLDLGHRHTSYNQYKNCYDTTIIDYALFNKMKNSTDSSDAEFPVAFDIEIFTEDYLDMDVSADVQLSDSLDKKALKRCMYLIKKSQQRLSANTRAVDADFLMAEVEDAIRILNKVKHMHLKLDRCIPAYGYLNVWITDTRLGNSDPHRSEFVFVNDDYYLNDKCDVDHLIPAGDLKPGAENWKRNGKIRLIFTIFKIANIWFKNQHPELLGK